MLYRYSKLFLKEKDCRLVSEEKKRISVEIMKLLDSQQLEKRTCRHCGKTLPFMYRYNVCDDCYEKSRAPYRPRHRY